MEVLIILYYLVCIAGTIGINIIWGKAANAVLRSRGYYNDWFWLGFFVGPAAILFALMKPDISNKTDGSLTGGSNYFVKDQEKKPGYWTCSCGQQNPSYTGTCSCGFCKY